MELTVVSSKICWADPDSPAGYATDGGFPAQMRTLSELFDRTRLVLTVGPGRPRGLTSLAGHNLEVCPLPLPGGSDLRRKLALLLWLPRHLPRLWREIGRADAVHTPVPGDVGAVAMLLALARKKPLFVRHCGTWGEPVTAADRALLWLLERVAGGRNVVLATGGAEAPPSARGRSVDWIFSTSLAGAELEAMTAARPWRAGEPLKLVAVGRLTAGKNVAAAIRALPLVRQRHPRATLDVAGAGVELAKLEALAADLGLADSVTLHGNLSRDGVLDLLGRSNLFVFPTNVKEGFPKALLEAMACGLPAVATAVSVIPRLVGGCGALLERTDPESVARAILDLTEDDRRLAEMSARARKTARAYSLERWRDEIGERLRQSWGRPLRESSAL